MEKLTATELIIDDIYNKDNNPIQSDRCNICKKNCVVYCSHPKRTVFFGFFPERAYHDIFLFSAVKCKV